MSEHSKYITPFTARNIVLGFFIAIFMAILIFFLIPYLITNKTWGWDYNQETGVMGDTIGGIAGPIVGFIGIILTFLAFYIQYQANQIQINALEKQKDSADAQEKQILLQQFENNFFELLKIHRENVSELRYRKNQGRNVMISIVNEFFEIMQEVLDSEIIRNNRLEEHDLANISYIILFFGTDDSVEDVLENRLFEKYTNIYNSIKDIIDELRNSPNPYNTEKYYYNGHQSHLGHYYRHLFRTVLFVHRNKNLTTNQKKDYIRILRAQLSNHEQVLLFFNSISDLGAAWELGENVADDEKLITQYHLIKNIPLGSIYGFNPKKYYPKIKLEHDFEIKL
ncbi:MAG TPA: putative phage abortive infection protein [Chitinophagales bacterium]|nr:putative phage abortive infection protein [Chitinophagales bacterium]